MKSYHVKFWAIRPGKSKSRRTYEVRWKVGHKPHSRTLSTKAQAGSFLSELRQAARAGEAFAVDAGLPDSMLATDSGRSWLAFCLAYVDMKWPSAAPKTRDSLTDALAAIIPAVVAEELPDGLSSAELRGALRHYMLAPPSRAGDRPPEVATALRWLEKNSLPVTEVGRPAVARAVLDAISPATWWAEKIATNVARDRDTDRCLAAAGWTVIRVWEHEAPDMAAARIAQAVSMTRPNQRSD